MQRYHSADKKSIFHKTSDAEFETRARGSRIRRISFCHKLTKFISALARGALLSANTFVKQHALGDFNSDVGGLKRLDFLESA